MCFHKKFEQLETTTTTATAATTSTNTSIMAPDPRSIHPIELTVDEHQETVSYQDFAHLISCLDSIHTSWPEVSPSLSDDTVPQTNDILCGRDREAYGHAGNRTFRSLISFYRDEYQHAKARDIKTGITREIIDSIRECGGRFLKKDEHTDVWCEVGDDYAHEKVSHALRSAKDPERKSQPKRHKAKDHPPTQEQDDDFQRLFADQQHLFRQLLEENQMSENFETNEQWSGISV